MSPAPLAAVAVTVAVVFLAIGARQFVLQRAAGWRLPPFGATAVTFGLGIGLFLASCSVVGRFAQSFDAGLLAAAVAGLALWGVSRRGRSERPAAPRVGSRDVAIAVALVQVGVLALYAYLSWQYQMHDEHAVFGHKSMVEQLRRGAYPVYYPSLPGQEARYHYGFDVLAGALARGYGLSADVAIDVVGLGLVLFMGWAAAAVVADEGAERSAPLGVLAIHFGAGLAFLMLAGVDGRHPRCMTQYHHPTCQVELFPTQLLNVFQHPVAVGVPMFLVFVLLAPRLSGVATRWSRCESTLYAHRSALAMVAVVVLGGLAVGQFVYFALGVLAALAALIVSRGLRRSFVLTMFAVVVLGLGLAALEGGMLAYNPSIDPGLVAVRTVPGFPKGEGPAGILWHHAVNLGLGFLLLPVFVAVSLKRQRPQVTLLTAFAIGGILVAHIFVYTRSWDIVKFPSAASFALSLLYVAVVDDRLRAWAAVASSTRRVLAGWGRRFGAALLMGTGVTAAIFVTFPLDGSLRLYDVGRWRRDRLVGKTIDWWRSRDYASNEVIYAQSNIAKELSIFGGLSVVAQDADLYYMGVDRAVLQRQRTMAARLKMSLEPSALRALSVRWLMFSDEEIRNLGPAARRRLASPPDWLSVAATFEGPTPAKRRRIWRIELRDDG